MMGEDEEKVKKAYSEEGLSERVDKHDLEEKCNRKSVKELLE